VGTHSGVEVVRGPSHVLLRPLAPGLVGGEPLARLLGRVGGARALLAGVRVGVGIGHPHTGSHRTPGAGRGAESSKCGYLTHGFPSLVAFCTPNDNVLVTSLGIILVWWINSSVVASVSARRLSEMKEGEG